MPSGHDPAAYVTRRLLRHGAGRRDGPDLAPATGADSPLDGSAPCLLYGYGAYGIAMPAAFDTERLSLVDRGFVYAIAHIRGGTEKGWRWYTTASARTRPTPSPTSSPRAELLVEPGYTAPGRIVAQGGCAGGMLMGAVANMAPDLFAAIIAEVPFVDVLNTMLDDDAAADAARMARMGQSDRERRGLRRPSWPTRPTTRSSAQAYPPILALGGLTDPRVTYWEPAKWVARLRARTTGGGPVCCASTWMPAMAAPPAASTA